MKVTFATIVFNGDYVLKELIESIYPHAHKIIFVDGVVDYWASQGYTGSVDKTVEIIENYPDPENKIILHKNIVRKEKTELCQVYMQSVPEDTDYLWCCDSDEIFLQRDYKKVLQVLESRRPHSIAFKSLSFFGGFDYFLGGFERSAAFKRILKYEPGCRYVEHRPPTMSTEQVPNPIHISSDEMFQMGVQMYHYSYTFPRQVHDKVQYYKAAVSKHNCIDDYFENVWLPWVLHPEKRQSIEDKYDGVHEFKPGYRGTCPPVEFKGEHPAVIQENMMQLKFKFHAQLARYGK